jgi:hypothetical protein
MRSGSNFASNYRVGVGGGYGVLERPTDYQSHCTQMPHLILRCIAVTEEELYTENDISCRNISQNRVELGYNVMKGSGYFLSLYTGCCSTRGI